MKMGSITKPADAAPGRILLRNDGKNTELLITTTVVDPNERHKKMVAAFRKHMPSSFVHATALNHLYWDVTDFARIQPDIASHQFSHSNEKHGEIFLMADGGLAMTIEYKSSGAYGHLPIALQTGADASIDPVSALRFPKWHLIAPNELGKVPLSLFDWPPPEAATATAAYR